MGGGRIKGKVSMPLGYQARGSKDENPRMGMRFFAKELPDMKRTTRNKDLDDQELANLILWKNYVNTPAHVTGWADFWESVIETKDFIRYSRRMHEKIKKRA